MLMEALRSMDLAPDPLIANRDVGMGFRIQPAEVEVLGLGGVPVDVLAGCEWREDENGLCCEISVTNPGAAPVPVSEIRLKFLLTAEKNVDRIFFQSWTMNGKIGVGDAGVVRDSSGVMGWSDKSGTQALVAGFLDHASANARLGSELLGEGTWRVTASVLREGVALAPDAILSLSPFWVRTGARLSALLEYYAGEVAKIMGQRRKKTAESGWCSWYHFYGKETFADVASCAGELAGSPLADSLRTIQIDDGWNREPSGNLPDAWGDWEAHPEKFPEGMAAAAREIHGLGFRAGLWLAPFAVARKSRFFVEHPDWLVQHRDPETGKLVPAPTDSPDIFSLDCTHPGALGWLRETFRRVFSVWGFDYIKIDFLHYGAKEGGIRHDVSATSVEAYRRGLSVINEVAGDGKFILACGAPLLASVGLVDGMRVGPDVGGRWLFDPLWPDWPVGNCSVRAAAISSFWSQWMHGHLWQNDPDCLVVRSESSGHEKERLGCFEAETALKNPDYLATPLGLSEEEAALWTRLVWLGGGMFLLSEIWGELSADRQALIAGCFPAHGRKVFVLDWFEQPDVAALVADGEPLLAGMFNFGDTPFRPVLSAGKLGLSGNWTLREHWSGELLQGSGELVVFPELPPHAGRVWEGGR